MATPTPNYPGETFSLGGKEWIVPAMSLRTLERFWPFISGLGKAPADGQQEDPLLYVQKVVEFTHLALRRNYPDLTIDEVADMIDMQNFQEVLQVVMKASGLVKPEKKSIPVPAPDSPSPASTPG